MANSTLPKPKVRADLFAGTRSDSFLDYAFDSTIPAEGETRAVGAFKRWYSGQIIHLCHTKAWLGSTFWLINGGMRPPTDFFAPRVVFAVCKASLLG
jgi:hypothetical protein